MKSGASFWNITSEKMTWKRVLWGSGVGAPTQKRYEHGNGCVECLRTTDISAQVFYRIQRTVDMQCPVNMFTVEDYVVHVL